MSSAPAQNETENGGQEFPPETGALRAEAPGFSITVRGSMLVILVAMLLADGALNLWVLSQLDIHLSNQDKIAISTHDDSVAMRAAISTEHGGQIEEIRRNRSFMREIERLCMLTPAQREKLQSNLTPAAKELLFEGAKP